MYIDDRNVTFEDLANIISDRIPEKLIFAKLDSGELTEHMNKFMTISNKQSHENET